VERESKDPYRAVEILLSSSVANGMLFDCKGVSPLGLACRNLDKAMYKKLLTAVYKGNIVTTSKTLADSLYSKVPVTDKPEQSIFSFIGEHAPATLLDFLGSMELVKVREEVLGGLFSAPLSKPLYVGLPFHSPQGFWQRYYALADTDGLGKYFEPIPATHVTGFRIPIPGLCGCRPHKRMTDKNRGTISTSIQSREGEGNMSDLLLHTRDGAKGANVLGLSPKGDSSFQNVSHPVMNPLQIIVEAATMIEDNSVFRKNSIVYELVQFKWTHLGSVFQREALIYLVYCSFCGFLSWSIAVTNECKQKELNAYYKTGTGVLGCICSVILFLMSARYFWRELKQFRFQFEMKRRSTKDDKYDCNSWRTFLLTLQDHFVKDGWNVIDFCAFVTQMFTDITFFCVVPGQQEIASVSILLVMLKMGSYARSFEDWGPFVRMVYYTCRDTFKFLTLVLILVAGFSLAFYVLLYDPPAVTLHCPHFWNTTSPYIHNRTCTFKDTGFGDWSTSFLTTFMLLFGQFNGALEVESQSWNFATFLMLFILILTAIILLNLLVAILSDAYQETNRCAEQETMLQRAQMIVEAENVDKIGGKFEELYPKWVHILKPAADEDIVLKKDN